MPSDDHITWIYKFIAIEKTGLFQVQVKEVQLPKEHQISPPEQVDASNGLCGAPSPTMWPSQAITLVVTLM